MVNSKDCTRRAVKLDGKWIQIGAAQTYLAADAHPITISLDAAIHSVTICTRSGVEVGFRVFGFQCCVDDGRVKRG